jgi:hypothetical protein
MNKSTILHYRHRTLILTLFSLAFVVILYYDLIFLHKNDIPITNPHPINTALVKEVSVNNSTSKNGDDVHTQQSSSVLLPSSIKTHVVKTTTSPQPAKSSHSSPISSHPQPSSSSEKHVSNKNPTMTMTSRSLPIVNNNNTNNNIQNNIPANTHLAIVPHHIIPSKMTTTNNNSRIVHKTIISKAPVTNVDPTEIYYVSSRISTQSQQQGQEQQLNSLTHSNLDLVSIEKIAANAGPNQKVKEGKKVTLDGSSSSSSSSSGSTDQTDDSSNTELNFLWKQIAGKSVKLSHIDTAKAKFKAPDVKKTTKLRFKLTVDDGKGNSSSDTVKIIVKPHKHNHHNHKH